jgi:isocitrate/isopropylmalate dehydrogenase
MLQHIGEAPMAERIMKALTVVLAADRIRTRDLGGTASTVEFAAAICSRLAA